jgi:hypothetical protein
MRPKLAGLAAALAAAVALAPAADASRPHAVAFGKWQPGAGDTCPASLHDSYSVVGPDGRLYPTWHPPVVPDPESGELCSFGHEHGRNPRRSDVFAWVKRHLRDPSARRRAGIPFGLANESLDAYAAANPGTSTRHEDHVGHKIEWQNDVRLKRSLPGGGRKRIGVECDFLTKVHQGTHSADALSNNVHELLYAVRCDDGTKLIATKLVSFGAANEFTRSCDKSTVIGSGGSLSYPAGGGARFIPDRACVDEHVLVPEGQLSQYSLGLYEDWISSNHLRTAGGEELAYFDPHFTVFNPSRYAHDPPQIGRTLHLCYEDSAGERARGGYCLEAGRYGSATELPPYEHIRSPFNGSHREVYFNQTTISNRGGRKRWWTDPYGGNASAEPFPGAICQLVGATDNTDRPALESQAFGAGRDYDAAGVHAPN